MAKKYTEIFLDSAETQYASGITPLLSIAALNKAVKFVPAVATEGSETANTADQYIIQRMKRVKAHDDPQLKSKKAGDNYVARLNVLDDFDWESVGTKRANKRILGVRYAKNENHDVLLNAQPFAKTIAQKVKNRMIEGEQKAFTTIAGTLTGGATPNTEQIDAYGANTEEKRQTIADLILKAIDEVQLLVDDYKAYSDNVVVFVHPTVARALAQLQGKDYHLGTNTFPKGFKGAFTFDGIEFYTAPILNAIKTGQSSPEAVGAIIMDMEAYANAGLTQNLTTFKDTLIDETIEGHTYSELDAIIDTARIKVIPLINGPTASKEVNA